MAPQAYHPLISLPIYMGTVLVSWAQTLMPLHPVEAQFHKGCAVVHD